MRMKRYTKLFFLISFVSSFCFPAIAQQKGNDVTAPLHAMKPDYPFLYEVPKIADVKMVLDKVYDYLDSVTPYQLVHRRTGEAVNSLDAIDTNTIVKPGDYRLTSYEWGVTYSAMLQAGEATADSKFTNYTKDRNCSFLESQWVKGLISNFIC